MSHVWPQHWPQPRPERRRVGTGASITDFLAYTTPGSAAYDPNFAGAWNQIQGQLNAEGTDVSGVNAAKEAMINSFSQLASDTLGVTGDEAIQASQQYVMLGQTAIGAVQTVGGLISAAQNVNSAGSFIAVSQAFTGVMIGAATAAGALSAGIGSAIILGVGALLNALGAAGFFGPSGGFQGPCGQTLSQPPDLIAGCVIAYGQGAKVQPGSPNWRAFPQNVRCPTIPCNDSSGNALSDGIWYQPALISGPNGLNVWGTKWKGLTWEAILQQSSSLRFIDIAFSNFHQVVEVDGPKSAFLSAFSAAWRHNAEYALNGLTPQPDEQVLIHCVRLWNRAHAGPATPIASVIQSSYAASLIYSAQGQVASSDSSVISNGAMYINTGNVLNPPVGGPAAAALVSGLSPAATAAVVAGATVGAAALGSVAYSLAIGESADWAIRQLWRKLFI